MVGLGYRFDKMDMIWALQKNAKKLSSDLNLRADISIRDNFSVIRRMRKQSNQLTSGQKDYNSKVYYDYVLVTGLICSCFMTDS